MTLIGALLLTFWYLLCDHLVTSEWSLHRRVYRQPPFFVKKKLFSIAHKLLIIVSYQPLGYKLKHLSGSILDVPYLISYKIVCLSNWLHNQNSLEHTNTSFSPTVTVYRTRWLPWEIFNVIFSIITKSSFLLTYFASSFNIYHVPILAIG